MKLTSILPALLAVGITAAPVDVEKRDSGFTAIAAHSGSPIHLQPINAAGSALYVGGATSSYCPSGIVDPCPPGNETVFMNAANLVCLFNYLSIYPSIHHTHPVSKVSGTTL